MLTADRRQAIGQLVKAQGSVSARELSKRFGVSAMTIYRDLKALEEGRELQRVRGGAVRGDGATEPLFRTKWTVNRAKKLAIARYAAEHLVRDHDIVVLEAGTTVTAMVRFLPPTLAALVANGLDALNEARDLVPRVPVLGCGGQLRSPSFTFVGPEAEAYFQSITADTVFLSATGFTFHDGITDPNPMEIAVKRAMATCAKRVVLLLDSSKFGKVSLRQLLPLGEIDVFVTDRGAPPDALAALSDAGVEVRIADPVLGIG